ncbi:GH36-type glycosyl hydrolase domain-containing protein [Chloroflexota bacterium]
MTKITNSNWQFIDTDGSFLLENPHKHSYLYFPLVNEAGMMSAITPNLNGDVKTDQNAFLTPPVSVEDLHTSRSTRNFWIHTPNTGAWSVTGNSSSQIAQHFFENNTEEVKLEAGILWHKLIRTNTKNGLRAETINFVPSSDDRVELMKVTLTNFFDTPTTITPTAAIPIYGRSADNLRDHRHVSSLLHRILCTENGVLTKPTLSFDERGHLPNHLTYAVLGAQADGTKPVGFIPIIEDFIGEGGTLDWPETVVKPLPPTSKAGQIYDGYETIGGIRFEDTVIQPGESKSYIIILAILEHGQKPEIIVENYGTEASFDFWLAETKRFWKKKLETFSVNTSNERFDLWTRWVAIQPTLRRLFGNSFLPYHDYGRGGRGWRDLWQDILALLLTESGDVRDLLYGNFAGVRIDGSNATIIGSSPGEFKADRNNIPRVWMDHGAWPLLTIQLYIDQTGDLAFLLMEQTYFKDHSVFRSKKTDDAWNPTQGTCQKIKSGSNYQGTILEHILIQHLTQFFNVGEHNIIRLEGADWNDGMDMATHQGESVAFTAFYASNLRQIGQLVLQLKELGITQLELAAEMEILLDSLTEPIDYQSPNSKQTCLAKYFESCKHTISGEKISLTLDDICKDLTRKSNWLTEHIRANEWLQNAEGFNWFNGYYNDDGQRVEGDHIKGVRMTLTGQVFTLMSGIASDEQALNMVKAIDHYLLDTSVGGHRLNTNFGEVLHNLGRAFGFAYGHKENGAMFSHMAVMYAYALYQRGFIQEGYQVLDRIYQHSQNFPVSHMYPGIPEYMSSRGRGMYTYLTGSASWFLLTLVTEAFGVRGSMGDLSLKPKLVRSQFNQAGYSRLTTLFAGKVIELCYYNPQKLDYGEYQIEAVKINNQPVSFTSTENQILILRENITQLTTQGIHLEINLGKNTR